MKNFLYAIMGLAAVACTRTQTPKIVEVPVPVPVPVVAPQGTTTSGGGGPYALEFRDIGRTVVRRLVGRGVKEIAGVNIEQFSEVLETLIVATTEAHLEKDGEPVDALNFPDEVKVLLSLVRWATVMDFFQKRRLIIHEVLGLMGKEGSKTYVATDQILKSLGHFENLDIYQIQVGREVAKTLIEKIPWRKGEITVERKWQSERTTYYTIDDRVDFIRCREIENLVPEYMFTSYFCTIRGQVAISDLGTVRVQLNFTHPLWRLFAKDDYEEYGFVFDYGGVRGWYQGALSYVEMFP